jgi:hypothetical protein
MKIDFTGVKDEPTFELIEPGEYYLEIIDWEEKTTKKGDPMVKIVCEISAGQPFEGKSINDFICIIPSMLWRLKVLLKCLGLPHEGEVSVNPDQWQNRVFKAEIIQQEYNDKIYNKIGNFIFDEKIKQPVDEFKQKPAVNTPANIAWDE